MLLIWLLTNYGSKLSYYIRVFVRKNGILTSYQSRSVVRLSVLTNGPLLGTLNTEISLGRSNCKLFRVIDHMMVREVGNDLCNIDPKVKVK